jgi:Tol biopolymer transport system component
VFGLDTAESDAGVTGLADTPWPMYMHDPQHTGRSSLTGIPHNSELLWVQPIPKSANENGGMTVMLDGDLLINDGYLTRFDPVQREIRWRYPFGGSHSVPVLDSEGNIYLGFNKFYLSEFAKVSSDGNIIWEREIDNQSPSGSPVFGTDGYIKLHHQYRLFSVDPLGNFVSEYDLPSYGINSPAIGLDGTVYVVSYSNLLAFDNDLNLIWALNPPLGLSEQQGISIGSDGTLYPTAWEGVLYAYQPNKTLSWEFDPDVCDEYECNMHTALADNGNIYLYADPGYPRSSYLFFVSQLGEEIWRREIPVNPVTGIAPWFTSTLLVDGLNNVYFCTWNSHCYGVSPDNELFWDYEFPSNDSMVIYAKLSPIIADNGLMYVYDTNHYDINQRLYAFADPDFYPVIRTNTNGINYSIDVGSLPITTTVSITSTVQPITFTFSISETPWLKVTIDKFITPAALNLVFDLSSMPAGIYSTTMTIKKEDAVGNDIMIPIKIESGINKYYLPVIFDQFEDFSIYYHSSYYGKIQFASIDQNGNNREYLSKGTGYEERSSLSQSDLILAQADYDSDNGRFYIDVIDLKTNETILEMKGSENYYYPSISPDGRKMVFTCDHNFGMEDLYLINTDGTDLTRITTNSSTESSILWSPIGNRFVFVSANFYTNLCDSNGMNCHLIFDNNQVGIPIGWSPDGNDLLVQKTHNRNLELWIFNIITGNRVYLTDNLYPEFGAVWSPDGHQIAYITKDPVELYTIHPDGSGKRTIINLKYGNIESNYYLDWSPGGTWIFFSQPDVKNETNMEYNIYAIQPDGSEYKRITLNLEDDVRPFCRP